MSLTQSIIAVVIMGALALLSGCTNHRFSFEIKDLGETESHNDQTITGKRTRQ